MLSPSLTSAAMFFVLNVQRQCQLRRGNGVVKTCCGNLGVQFFSLKITVKHGKYHVQCSRLFALVPACLHVEKAFEKFLFRQISVVAEVVKCFRRDFPCREYLPTWGRCIRNPWLRCVHGSFRPLLPQVPPWKRWQIP